MISILLPNVFSAFSASHNALTRNDPMALVADLFLDINFVNSRVTRFIFLLRPCLPMA